MVNRVHILSATLACVVCSAACLSDASATRPKRYAKLSLDELMALHIDAKAKADREALKDALRLKLADAPTEQLLELRRAAQAPGPRTVADPVFPLPSLQTRIRKTSVVVYGRITRTDYDRDDLIRDILAREIQDARSYVTIEALDSYPKESVPKVLTFLYRPDFGEVGHAYEKLEFLFVLQRSGEKFESHGILNWFVVNHGRVRNVSTETDIPLDEAWKLIAERCMTVSGNNPASAMAR